MREQQECVRVSDSGLNEQSLDSNRRRSKRDCESDGNVNPQTPGDVLLKLQGGLGGSC